MITDYQNWTSLITQTHMKKKHLQSALFDILLTHQTSGFNTHECETYLFYVIVAEQKPWRFCFCRFTQTGERGNFKNQKKACSRHYLSSILKRNAIGRTNCILLTASSSTFILPRTFLEDTPPSVGHFFCVKAGVFVL